MTIKKFLTSLTLGALSLAMVGCSSNTSSTTTTSNNSSTPKATEQKADAKDKLKVVMITDQGGINDKSFNQSAYEGLTQAQKDGLIDFSYLESHAEADYAPNLEQASDDNPDLIFSIGYALYVATDKAAKENDENKYAVVDNANTDGQKNLVGLTFADNENSFLVGYIAGMTTQTNNVGFVGGQKSDVIDRFDYGFRAGVKYAARELKKDIQVQVQYADSYSDQGKGKTIANQMYQKGADIIFHAAGGTGIGVIASAVDNNKWVIGVDRDQKDEAPNNMLVSTIKGVNKVVQDIAKELKEGKFEGGSTRTFGLKDGDACTIAYADNDLVSKDTKDKVEKVRKDIIDGKIKVPQNEKEFSEMGYDK